MRAARPGHETRDIDVRRVGAFAALLVAVVGAVLLLMLVAFDYFASREARRQPEPTTLAGRPVDQLPPEPRLQDDPLRDLLKMREEEDELLHGYGWVDRRRGTVRIPVERAMEIVAREGEGR